MDENKLSEWERLSDSATPGPWRQSDNELGYGTYDILAKGDFPNIGIATVVDGRFSDVLSGSVALCSDVCNSNAAFIALARTAVPELCKEVRRLKKIEQTYAETLIEQVLDACDDPVVFELLKPDLLKLRDYFISHGLMKE